MVCEKCEKKLTKIAPSDPLKNRPRNVSTLDKKEKVKGENKILASRSKNKFSPYEITLKKCRICKTSVHQVGSHYCQGCAYKKGICAMCGKAILSTKGYNQRSV